MIADPIMPRMRVTAELIGIDATGVSPKDVSVCSGRRHGPESRLDPIVSNGKVTGSGSA
jgi:hypothetical protein